MRSFGPGVPGSATQSPEPPSHWFAAVAVPLRPQAEPGQIDVAPAVGHGAPALAPPVHRSPPQMPAPPEQSAFELHGVAAALSQVSHWHLLVVQPPDVHVGFDADRVRVLVPVVLSRLIGRVAISAPPSGGQSRLVEPNAA